ncbi:MAG: hypothetical protein H0X13_15445 [Ramlibacter sp.]|nr:hypothetical protein [Ramlibacter sp.]
MSEAVIDDGVSPYGTRTKIHIATDTVIEQKTFDAEPLLQYAEQARQATDGQRWGEGRLVGTIPMAIYAHQFLNIRDNAERQKAIKAWLRENSKFVMFDKYLK